MGNLVAASAMTNIPLVVRHKKHRPDAGGFFDPNQKGSVQKVNSLLTLH
jgi:hypothetical protein